MKTLWSAVSILAVANILALMSVVGYLAMTDRLSRERLRTIRVMLSQTVGDQKAQEDAARTKAEAQRAQAVRDANLDEANAGVELRNELFHTLSESQQEIIRRAKADLDSLSAMLNRRLAEVEKREKAVAAAQTAFEARFGKARDDAAQQQFDKMVSLLNGLKAQDIKGKLDVYLSEGRADLVIDILNALPQRNASKVLALYKTQPENAVAADLLLQLRNQGLGITDENPTDDQRTAAAIPAN